MARPGDVIENPITGERFIFRQTARDTNGTLLEFELKIETFFETLCGLAREGKINKRGMPNLWQGAILAREYETFLPWLPIPVQRAGLGVLAPIGRLLGYRARYLQYSGPE